MNVSITNTKSDCLKFAVYVRRSKYHASGESIENQIKMCKEYIFSHYPDATDEDIFIYDQDDDISAKDTNRKDFQKMMESAKKKKFDYVVCYKTDRLNRKLNDFSNTHEFLKSKNIGIISVTQQFDTSNYNGRLHMNLLASVAEWEREAIAERVKDGMMYLATKGRWLAGKAPCGFNKTSENRVIDNGQVKLAHYLEVNSDIEKVKIIYSKFIETGSLRCVIKHLAENGIKSVNNRYYYNQSLEHILRNPVYCTGDKHSFEYFKKKGSDIYFSEKDFKKKLGISAYNRSSRNTKIPIINDESKWVVALGKHQGIITGKDWITVQNILDNRKGKGKTRTHMTQSLLAGLIRCTKCGDNLMVKRDSRPDRNGSYYYVCSQKKNIGMHICDMKNLNGIKADKFAIDYIFNFDKSKLKKDLNITRYSRKVNKFEDKVSNLNFEIYSLEKEKDKYINHLKNIETTSPLFKDIENKVKKINDQINKKKDQKRIYEAQFNIASDEKADIELVLKNLEYFKKNIDKLDFDHKKSLLRLIINKLTWDGNEIKIFLVGEQT
jgi:site-specific DNA recombinase